jgi:hypothetical protein
MSAPITVSAAITIDAPRVDQSETGLLSLAVDGTDAVRAGGMGNDERWFGGYQYQPEIPGNVVHNASQITGHAGANIGSGARPATVATIPWTLEVVDTLTTAQLGVESMEDRARRVMQDYTSYLLERELWLGELKAQDNLPNRVLQSTAATNLTPGTLPTPQAAVAMLVGAMNRSGFPTVMVHAAKDVALRLPDGWRNQQTLTDHGFVVVGGAGYPGTGPTGQTGPNWVYATSMVNYRLGPIEVNFGNSQSYLDRGSNNATFRAMRVGATDFAGPVYACQVAA